MFLILAVMMAKSADEAPAALAARKLAREFESRASVELTIHTEPRMGPGVPAELRNNPSFDSWDTHFIENAGRRLLEIRYFMGGKDVKHEAHYSDGAHHADVTFSEVRPNEALEMIVRPHFYGEDAGDRMERPDPLLYLYVGRQPLHVALPSATPLGKDTVLKRECDVFLFKGVRWYSPQDHVYYLDHETAIPLKVESFLSEDARAAGHPAWTWTADSLDKVDDHEIVLNSTMIDYDRQHRPNSQWKTRGVSASFNGEYPNSTFWPKLEPGMSVFDMIKSKSYVVPGVVKKKVDASGMPIPPVLALPPSDWVPRASGISIGLGCVVLSVSGALWRRNR